MSTENEGIKVQSEEFADMSLMLVAFLLLLYEAWVQGPEPFCIQDLDVELNITV